MVSRGARVVKLQPCSGPQASEGFGASAAKDAVKTCASGLRVALGGETAAGRSERRKGISCWRRLAGQTKMLEVHHPNVSHFSGDWDVHHGQLASDGRNHGN